MNDKEAIGGGVRLREILIFGLLIVISFFAFVKVHDKQKLVEDKTRAEERAKMYEQRYEIQAKTTDSLKTIVAVKEGIIKHQDENPRIIREKYEKVHDNLDLLNTDDNVRILSDRLSEESGHR